MSLLVTFNGSIYTIPTNNEVGWGTNLDNYLVAIAAGCLQKTGGSFLLSAETDFGAAFGLKALYYKSRSSNVADAGPIRFANNTDGIYWRDSTNSSNHVLTVDSSDLLTFDGVPVAVGGSGTVLTGVANTLAYYPASTNTVDNLPAITSLRALQSDASGLPVASSVTATELGYLSGVTSAIQTQFGTKKSIATGNAYKWETTDSSGNLQETTITASRAIASDANGLPVASATTATELGFVAGVTSAIQTQLNAKASDASVVHLTGNESIAGTKTFTSSIVTPAGSASAPSVGLGDAANGPYRSATNEVSIATNGTQRVKVDSSGNIYGTTSGAALAVQNTYNSISVESVGDLTSAITIQDAKTFTITIPTNAKVFAVALSDGSAALVSSSFATATITLLGTSGSIVASAAPTAFQLGIFKSAGSQVISFKSGSSLTSVATTMWVTVLAGTVSAATNWA